MCTLRLESEPLDEPAPTAELAHTTSGMLTVTLLIRGADHKDLIQPILGLLDLVRDGAEEQEQVYLKGGDLRLRMDRVARTPQSADRGRERHDGHG